jgi:hypothetical protein
MSAFANWPARQFNDTGLARVLSTNHSHGCKKFSALNSAISQQSNLLNAWGSKDGYLAISQDHRFTI